MLTFEQLQPALHKWARYFRGRLFEHWELINAVWEKGSVQKLEHIEYASWRVKCDMIDYMRTVLDLRVRNRKIKQGKFHPKAFYLSTLSDDEEGWDVGFCLSDTQKKSRVDTEDYLVWLLKGLSRDRKLIIRLRYQCNYQFKEIAEIIGIAATAVCWLHKDTLLRLRRRLMKAGEQMHLCTRLVKTGMDKDAMSRYFGAYYNLKRKHIQKERRTA